MYSIDDDLGISADDKQPSETRWYEQDFSELLGSARIANMPSVIITPLFDSASQSPLYFISVEVINGMSVRALLGGGGDGERYKITYRVSDDSTPSATYESDFVLRVRDY